MTDTPHAPAGTSRLDVLDASDDFVPRHVGPDEADIETMLDALGYPSLDALVDAAVPESIRRREPLRIEPRRGEHALLEELREIASRNRVFRSMIGMGYADCITPPVILRNVMENPGWYTQYTPYQSEIAQGRLEALLNFQTMVSDLTGLEIANASLLDEATAAAEAMAMCRNVVKSRDVFVVSPDCHPQTIEVVKSRAGSMGVQVIVDAPANVDLGMCCGVLVQYPATDGAIHDYRALADHVHAAGALLVMAADLLSLTLLTPPGEIGADVAVGSAQRFGVPLGFGGPHAAFFATHEKHVRRMPGRLIGVTRDADGHDALRMAIQTREQHIKRDRATSNICTAQVLLAIMASMYAVYHGPDGLRRIAERVHGLTVALANGLRRQGHAVADEAFFDTITVRPHGVGAEQVLAAARERGINLRERGDGRLGISLDETTTRDDVLDVLRSFAHEAAVPEVLDDLIREGDLDFPEHCRRTSDYLTHQVFNTHRSETEMLRYLKRLENRDLSLAQSMIPLGSCTMKLNGTSEMLPVTWPEFARIHPFAPAEQTRGYHELFRQLENWLAEITGFDAVSLQPNAGSQGEYAGLLVIRAWQADRGEIGRTVCLIPTSAHGTNPASAVIAGMRVVPVACDENGNIDVDDLRAKAELHSHELGALMITYPSTHGVFESSIREICSIVHEHGGQVYMDGANMNAQVGLCRPGDIGADVCHLNLHKTFCIPHGGGGPGMGPIGVAEHLAPFLPGHCVRKPDSAGDRAIGAISAAPYGSPSILPISWMYIALMGVNGLTHATKVAILNANYMAKRLETHYDVLFRGNEDLVAHEFILDCRPFDKTAGIKIDDIAKRLIDFGFHAPTMSWPVPGTLMVEPTESESLEELDRFCDAMIAIRDEIRAIENGESDRDDNPLRNAPHSTFAIGSDEWSHPYTRQQAAWPLPWLAERKFWPAVGRVDNVYGDRNLMCTCPSVEDLAE